MTSPIYPQGLPVIKAPKAPQQIPLAAASYDQQNQHRIRRQIEVNFQDVYADIRRLEDDIAALGGSGGATTLAALTDTTISGTPTDRFLRHNGTAWVDAVIGVSDLPSHTHDWSQITSTPTTLAGYGITDAQPLDADLTAIAALSSADGNFIVGSPGGWIVESGATARTSLGLTIGTDVQAWDVLLDDIAALVDPNADRILFWDDSAGVLTWLTVGSGLQIVDTTLSASGSGGLTSAYASMTDGTTTANASGGDTFKFRSANNAITVAVQDNDVTHGDNLLLTFNEANITITESQISDLGNYLTVPTLTQYGVVYAATTSTITSTAAPSSGSVAYSPDATSWNVTGGSVANQVLLSTGIGLVGWGTLTSAYTSGTFPPDSHTLDSHTGTLSVTNIAAGPNDSFLVTRASTVQWGSIGASDLPSHDLISTHTASGLTAGHVLRATGATTFAFQALQSSDLPSHTHDASDITTGTFAAARLGLSLAYQIPYTVDGTALSAIAAPATNDVLVAPTGVPAWGKVTSSMTTGTFPPDAHTFDSHTGTLSVSNIAAGPTDSFLVSRGSPTATVQWGSIAAGDLPSHDLITTHSASGLTTGHVLRATGVTTFAFEALQASDLPTHTHDAGDITTGVLPVLRGGTGQSSWTTYGVVYSPDGTSLSDLGTPGNNNVLLSGGTGIPGWNKLTATYTTGTFPPDSHSLDSHTGTLSVTNITAGANDTFLVTRASTVQWGTIQAADLPSHDLITTHSASGLTAGHVLRATGATTFAFAALQAGDLPSHTHDASDVTSGTFAAARLGLSLAYQIPYTIDGTALSAIAAPSGDQVLRSATGVPGWGTITSSYTTGTFPPDSHAYSSHTGTVPVADIAFGANDTFLVTRSPSTVQWGSIQASDLPSHDLITAHSASGLTAGHVLRATGAATFAFGAIQLADLPTITVPGGGTGLTTITSGGIVYGNGTGNVNVTAAPGALGALVYGQDATSWNILPPNLTGGTDKVLQIDGVTGALSWVVPSTGGLANAYANMTDGTTTASASGGDTFKFRSANTAITVAVGSNDVTHGDNLLLTFNEANISVAWSQVTSTPTTLAGYGITDAVSDSELAAWTGSANITTLGTIGTGVWQGTAVGSNYGGTGLTNVGIATGDLLYSPDGTSWDGLTVGGANTVLRSNGTLPSWGTITSAYTTGTFPPDSHSLDSHTGTLSLSNLGGAAPTAVIRSTTAGTAWEVYNGGSTGQPLVVTTAATNPVWAAGNLDLQYTTGTLPLAQGGTGASLSDPGADRILYWNDLGSTVGWLTTSTGTRIQAGSIRVDWGATYLTTEMLAAPDGIDLLAISDAGVSMERIRVDYFFGYLDGLSQLSSATVTDSDFFIVSDADGTGNNKVRRISVGNMKTYLGITTPTYTQYGLLYADTTSTSTSTAAPSSGSVGYSPDGTSWNVTGASAANQVLRATGAGLVGWGAITSAYTTGTFPPSSHTLDSHTGTLSVTNIAAGAAGTFLGMTGATVAWQSIVTADISDLSSWAGSTSITTLGTIGTGTWQATPIASAYIGSHTHTASQITDFNTAVDTRIDTAQSVSAKWTFTAGVEDTVTQFGDNAQPYTTLASTDWDGVAGYRRFVNAGTSTGEPSGAGPGIWWVMGRRDTAGGYFGLYIDNSGNLWAGVRYDNSTDGSPTWERIVDTDYAGTTAITGVGTITSGTWQGTAIASAYIGSHTHTASQITDFNTAVDNRLDTAQTISATWTFSSVQSFPAGSAASPAMRYSADTDTGIFFGTAQVRFSAGNSEVGRFTSAGLEMFGQVFPNDFFNTNDNDAFSPDWNNGNSQRVTATSTTGTLAITVDTANMKAGAGYMLVIYNESGGNKAISVSGVDSWGSSSAPTATMTNDRTTVMQFLAMENGAGTGLRVVGTTVLDNVALPA